MASVVKVEDPWFLNTSVTSAEARAAMIAGFAGAFSGSTVAPEGGVLLSRLTSPLAVNPTTPSASMAVTVAPGQVVIPRANQFGYTGTVGTITTVDISAANATNPRIDTVIANVRDAELSDPANILGNKGLYIEVIPGTPSGSPTAPDLSGYPSAYPLADVTVPALATSITAGNITDRRKYTRAAGGIRYAGRDTARPGSHVWDYRIHPDTGALETWDNTAGVWVPMAVPGAWTSYTPTWAGIQIPGSGAISGGRYLKTGRRVRVRAWFVGGSGTSLGTGFVTVGLPFIAAGSPSQDIACGTGVHRTAVGGTAIMLASSISPTAPSATVWGISNTNNGWVSPGSVPLPWVAGSVFNVDIEYETAA